MRILRVFGLPAADVRAALRAVQAEGCSGLRLLERDGEFAVCVQVSAPTQAMADEYCEKWVQKLRARLGDTVYADGETGLAQATLDVLLKKRRLLVAADETTGRLIGARLQPLEHSEAAYDFGTQTWADRETARKLVTPASLLEKFPGDVVQAAAGRAQLALAYGGADYAVVYMPATVGQAPFVLLCDKRGAVATAVSPDHSDAAIANSLLDMVRRRALGLKPLPSAITFRPGHERPLLIVSQEGQPRSTPVTGRFTPRRTRTAARTSVSTDTAPTGTITFEKPTTAPAAKTTPAAPATPAQETPVPDSVIKALGFDTPAEPDPLDFTTAGPQAAAASRSQRGQATASFDTPLQPVVPAGDTARRGQPAPSLLDDDIPDFSAGLDPKAIAEAMAADEKEPPHSTEDLQQAASMLFDKVDVPPSAPSSGAGKRRTPDASAIKNRSLAMIEKTQRRRRRGAILTFLCIVLVLALGAGGIWYFFHNDLGVRPAPKSYGTATFDETAEKYLTKGMKRLDGVAGYLALPGMNGQFVYAQDRQDARSQSEEASSIFATEDWLGSSTPSNTVIEWGGSLANLEDIDAIQDNSGFTLYLPGTAYRCKVVAVYYQDPSEEGGFDPTAYTDLSNYYEYLDFSLNIGTRSLYNSTSASADGESYLTLVGDSSTEGVRLCVTGRLVHDDEDPALTASISTNENALLTGLQYESAGKSAPDRMTLMSSQMERYTTLTGLRAGTGGSGTQNNGTVSSSADNGMDASLASLTQQTQDLIASADDLLAGLTDIAGQSGAAETDINQGAEGTLPEQTVTIDSITSGSSSSSSSTEGGDAASSSDASSDSGTSGDSGDSGNSGDAGNSGNSGGSTVSATINVTMNGTAQTMDLVTCLAMVAQNELGPNAPAEAYKAQCVATHSWILSQSGYPSVAGTTPGSAATAAAQEVANVLVTYNGQVCFTPYFASASTGTASAADVWGNSRPWLVAVDSPYDQSVASNWNTNGYNTGCARFSRQTLQDRIKEKMGVDLSGVDPNSWFTILSKNEYGWVTQMQIGPNASGNDTCSGRWFREVLTAGCSVDGRSLRSQCFTVTYDAGLDCFIFDVYGYGHGCGMSQWGAIGYAQNGWNYQQILQHYYPGTTLTTIG